MSMSVNSLHYFFLSFRSENWINELEPDTSEDEDGNSPRIGTDYLGRPVLAPGPSGRPTLLLQNYHGDVGWLDIEGQHWYRFSTTLNRYVCGASELHWRHEGAECIGTNDSGGHNHPGLITPVIVRLIRWHFAIRNFCALWGQKPNGQQYNLIARFYADRILDASTPFVLRPDCPAWAIECAHTRYPYGSEFGKAHFSVKVAKNSCAPLSCVLELNSFCEFQRYSHLECYTGPIPLDYEQARDDRIPDRTLPYIQRWPVSGVQKNFF